MPRRYARGDKAKAMCPRCGHIIDYQDLQREREDVYVCPSCLDDAPPPRPKTPFVDPQQLHHPRPFRDQLPTTVIPEPDRPPMNIPPFLQNR